MIRFIETIITLQKLHYKSTRGLPQAFALCKDHQKHLPKKNLIFELQMIFLIPRLTLLFHFCISRDLVYRDDGRLQQDIVAWQHVNEHINSNLLVFQDNNWR